MTICGIQWVQSTDTHTRLGALSGKTLAESIALCNTYDPWKSMRRCNLWDSGVVTAWDKDCNVTPNTPADICYTDTDTFNMGQVTVRLKKFWYTTEHAAGTYKWWITNDSNDVPPAGAWKVHPAFIRNGITKDQIYIGAFGGHYDAVTGMLDSKAWVFPTASKTLAQFRGYAEARAGTTNKWECYDYLTHTALQLLFLIEYGDFDAQHLLGGGFMDLATGPQYTGWTGSTPGNDSGNLSYGVVDDYTHVMSYRGIENWYGNLSTVLEGINIKTSFNPWIADHDYATNYMLFAHPYVDTTLNYGAQAGNYYIDDIITNDTWDFILLPTSDGGSATTYLCDAYYTLQFNRIATSFGSYNAGTTTLGGPFAMDLAEPYDLSSAVLGARLVYIG